jgi:hypothetical protein
MVRAALVAAALLALLFAVPAMGDAPREYGRERVAQFSLPLDELLPAPGATPATRDRGTADDAALWTGPAQAVGAGRNPYTMVVTLTGTARAAGDVRTSWQGGWEVHESPQATREVRMPVGNGAASAQAPGQPISLTLVSGPVSFRGERQVSPLLHRVAASNLELRDVQVQVWSGPAPIGLATLSVQRPALLGVALLCALAFWWLRRFKPLPQRPRDAVDTRLPVVRSPHADAANSMLPAPARDAAPAIDALLEHHWPEEHRARAVGPAPSLVTVDTVERATPPQPRISASASVVATLHDVLRGGPAVGSEADTRPRRARRSRGAPGAAQG